MAEDEKVQYSFYLSKSLLERLQTAAWKLRLPLAELLRSLSEEFLSKRGG